MVGVEKGCRWGALGAFGWVRHIELEMFIYETFRIEHEKIENYVLKIFFLLRTKDTIAFLP